MKVKLDISLIFDAREVWASTDDFESDFANFLMSKSLLGEKVQCADDQNDYYRTIYISVAKQEPDQNKKAKAPIDQKKDILSKFKTNKRV